MSFITESGKVIESIDTSNTDFYKWGANCSKLGYSVPKTQSILDNYYGPGHEYSQEDLDNFWSGYDSSIDNSGN